MKVQKITICGGGNGAQTVVPIAIHNLDCTVDIYASYTDEAERLRLGVTERGGIETTGAVQVKARPGRISADPGDVIPGSELVLLVVPAFAHEVILREIIPFLERGAWVGAMPARGGFDYCAFQILERNDRGDIVLFGLQTLPWACRIQEYGRSVQVLGTKRAVDIAVRPVIRLQEVATLLEEMMGLTITSAGNFLALTLANTGQLIHPGIMYALFYEWKGESFREDEIPLFYHGLSKGGAQTLTNMSADIQSICVALDPRVDLSAVRSLKSWMLHSYRHTIEDFSSLQSAFVTNRAYAGLRAPMREISKGQFVPDFQTRYLSEDVPYGLSISQSIGRLAGVDTPAIESVIAWAEEHLGKDYMDANIEETRTPQRFGIQDIEALITFNSEKMKSYH
jgi:hypothetical protein